MQRYASFDIGEKNFAYFIAVSDGKIIKAEKMLNINFYEKKQTIIEACIKISQHLKDEEIFQYCDTVLIEQQAKRNIRAQRISQHVWTWFYTKFPNKKILFIPAYLKTQHFIGRNNLSSRERKIWSVKHIEEIIHNTNQNFENVHIEPSIQDYFFSLKKKDDVSDAILQVLAYLKV